MKTDLMSAILLDVPIIGKNTSMSKNTSISVGDHFTDFIHRQVDQGRYSSASEVVRAGLRLLEEREASLKALQAALIDGENSGTSTPFDFETFIAQKRKDVEEAG